MHWNVHPRSVYVFHASCKLSEYWLQEFEAGDARYQDAQLVQQRRRAVDLSAEQREQLAVYALGLVFLRCAVVMEEEIFF